MTRVCLPICLVCLSGCDIHAYEPSAAELAKLKQLVPFNLTSEVVGVYGNADCDSLIYRYSIDNQSSVESVAEKLQQRATAAGWISTHSTFSSLVFENKRSDREIELVDIRIVRSSDKSNVTVFIAWIVGPRGNGGSLKPGSVECSFLNETLRPMLISEVENWVNGR